MEQNDKGVEHEWRDISFVKDAFWFVNFKSHTNYIISVLQYFSNSTLIQKFIFFNLLFLG
jgi:hypothetical protein